MIRIPFISGLLVALTSVPALAAESYYCSGAEPFWGMTIDEKGISLTDRDAVNLQFAPVASVRSANDARQQVMRHERKDSADVVVMLEEDDACSDGMSEKKYEYRITYSGPFYEEGPVALTGCCVKR